MIRIYFAIQMFIVFVCASGYLVLKLGENSKLPTNSFLLTKIVPNLQVLNGRYIDLKFGYRGPRTPGAKITIVGIDEASLAAFGQWPWPRQNVGDLIELILQSGAKVVGLDIVFGEPEKRIPDDVYQILEQSGFGAQLGQWASTDGNFAQTITKYADQVVLGWASQSACRPRDEWGNGLCSPAAPPESEERVSKDLNRFSNQFAIPSVQFENSFRSDHTPLVYLMNIDTNHELLDKAAKNSGTFMVIPDHDGVIRRTNLILTSREKFFPSLPLAMARAGLGESLKVEIDKDDRLKSLSFEKSNISIPVNGRGEMLFNFLGPSYSFRYVSASSVVPVSESAPLAPGDKIKFGRNRDIESTREELFKDAYVFIGAEALGLKDMRHFPFDPDTPGVEGHATALENILTQNYIRAESEKEYQTIFIAMIITGLVLAGVFYKLPSLLTLGVAAGILAGLGYVDFSLLFAKSNRNYSLVFNYIMFVASTFSAIGVKYVAEEKEKKFIQGAFGKILAPTVVDQLVKDPEKLKLGGEKKNLTILFSDIRSFTSFSEKLEAPKLGALLNEYLGEMTATIVTGHNATLDKYIGDAIMAFWGAPIDIPDHAHKGITGAIEMQQKLKKMRPHFMQKYGVEINVGIGLNTGTVNVGFMGSSNNMSYTVIGDHVNTASRIESLTKYYGATILTSQLTMEQIVQSKHKPPVNMIVDKVKVKGKETAIDLIQIFYETPPEEFFKKFKSAFDAYLAKDFQGAKKQFQALAEWANNQKEFKHLINGTSSELFIERCDNYISTPPPAQWDGAFAMEHK